MSPFYLYIILALICDVSAIVSSKFYSLTHNSLYLVGSIIGLGLTGFFFCKSLNYEGVAIANITWSALSAILITLIGYFYFKENLSLLQGIGMGIIVIGLILVNSK